MKQRVTTALSTLLVVVALVACASRSVSTGSLLPHSAAMVKYAAVYGDDQAELRSAIELARKRGDVPSYLVVKAKNETYEFPLFAILARSKRGLLVEAYRRVYAMPLRSVTVSLKGPSRRVAIGALPRARAPYVDRILARGARGGQFHRGAVRAKRRICPDCVMLVTNRRAVSIYARRWRAVKDPWQNDAARVSWQKTGQRFAPQQGSCVESGGCAPCGPANTCSYNGGSGASAVGGGGGGCGTNRMIVTTGKMAPNSACTGGGGGGEVACSGSPSSCQNVPCSGSPETISDYFRPAGSNATIEVMDINSIWQDGSEVGWLYLGSNGVRYIQLNYSTQAGVSLGGTLFGIVGISVSTGSYSNIRPWRGSLPAGSATQKCESGGAQLA